MHSATVPINATTQLIEKINQQLEALNSLQLPKESLHAVRLLQLRRLTRQIETLIPGHFGHGERTAHYALLLGKAIGLPDEQQVDLHYAALLHDVGLLTLPDKLLNEAADHTLDDYALIQSHPREGAAFLSPYRFLYEAARLIAHHHERWDGAGYPYGLRGTYIPVAARILAIADVFDTIATRSASLHQALRLLKTSAGAQFDPILSATFCAQFRDQDRRQGSTFGEATIAMLNTERTSETPTHKSTPLQFSRGVVRIGSELMSDTMEAAYGAEA
ncbi:MAG: HD domain-containing phosphohydrolase [Nitrospira sp.]|nr:HD domain-containing protein [Nitrospira sp.]